ncbi:hypothetical protein [Catellatospora tritici]|uniref:hypothetical protein n=1 Tax=Catellatospora tritici TaxID=2851566 RepID=UPI001C2D8113|nr:hypothetical protein [Catellatospora tritici]MBV1848713.1 hypothetical protein [Catellatospora tritici]
MITRSSRTLRYALVAALATLGTAACDSSNKPEASPTSASASPSPATAVQPAVDEAVRGVVSAYLDAVESGDFEQGHLLICADVREQYDAVAKTNAGTFGPRFTLTAYAITETRAAGATVEVRAAQKVTVAGRPEPMKLTIAYTMARAADSWCIAQELPVL